MPSVYDRIETDNPLLDEIIYNSKLILKSIIVKDEAKAIELETQESLTNFDIYLAIVEGRASLYYFENITIEDFHNAIPGLSARDCNRFMTNYRLMNKYQTKQLLTYLSSKYLSEYEETNEYYREIIGLPPYGEDGVYITKRDANKLVLNIDYTKPVHEFTKTELAAIKSAGILDRLIEENPEAIYLRYIDKGITLLNARLADKYAILYMDPDVEDVIASKFQELYLTNVDIAIRTMDDPAFKYYNPLFTRFLMMDLVINSIADMISEFSEFIINREVFDIRTAEYFFNAFGVTFYKEIPLKYQKKIIRSLNRLIKYKGTPKDMITITKIFGFDGIQINKYYLNKAHKRGSNKYDVPVIRTDSEGNSQEFTFKGYTNYTNPSANYEMNFIRVPLGEAVNDYLKDPESTFKYDEFVKNGDQYWNGDRDHEEVKKKIMGQDFNTLITQYMSLSTETSVDDVSFEITYFINMLMYYDLDPKNMTFTIPGVSGTNTTFNIFDALVYIYALMYLYIGVDENAQTIVLDPAKLCGIHNFNLYEELDELQTEIEELYRPLLIAEQVAAINEDYGTNGYIPYTVEYLKETKVGNTDKGAYMGPDAYDYISIMESIFDSKEGFQVFSKAQQFTGQDGPKVGPSMKQVVNAYIHNKGVHDFLVKKMLNTQDIRDYKIYKTIYDSLMITNLNNNLFMINKKGSNKGVQVPAKSYIQYLQYNNSDLYGVIDKVLELKGKDEFKTTIYNYINTACESVISYIDSEELLHIFTDLPIDTVDYMKMYMTKIIEFFMSYKVTMIDTGSTNIFSPEKNRLVDHVYTNSLYWLEERVRANDKIAITAQIAVRDSMRQNDRIIVRRMSGDEYID